MTETGKEKTIRLDVEILSGTIMRRYGLTEEDLTEFFESNAPLMEIRALEAAWKVIDAEIGPWTRGKRHTEPGGRGLPPQGRNDVK